MSKNFERYNDGTSAPPRLRVDHSQWALTGLPINAPVEWTLREKFQRVRDAGFEAVMCRPTTENEVELMEALREFGLGLVVAHSVSDPAELAPHIDRAARLGADFLFLQPGRADSELADVVRLVRTGRELAHRAGLAYFVEVHRNYFTENLPQTLQLIAAMPEIRMTADLSHLVLAGEFYGWPEEKAVERLLPILQRTGHVHGRVSNGEQIQVDMGDGSGQSAQFFVELWSTAMRYWLVGAGPGDVFPFASELGPPRYALTLPNGSEFSDRWEQSLVMKRLAEQAWQKALAAGPPEATTTS